jgi:hypothetical protein
VELNAFDIGMIGWVLLVGYLVGMHKGWWA